MIALILPSESFAAVPLDPWYVGAKVGWVDDDHPINSGLFVGHVAADWLVVEAGYEHFSSTAAAANQFDWHGVSVVAKPYWRLTPHWALFGQLGFMRAGQALNSIITAGESGDSPVLGAGVGYQFNRNWRTALQYQWFGEVGGQVDIKTVNLSLIYRFTSTATEYDER